MSHFAELLDEEPEVKYRTIVINTIKNIPKEYGYIDYKGSKQLAKQLDQLVARATASLSKKDLLTSLAIVKAIIEELPPLFLHLDDSSGTMQGIFQEASELLK